MQRETPKALTTTLYRKLYKGTRLIIEPNGNKVRDMWTIRSVTVYVRYSNGYDSPSTTERVWVFNDSLTNLKRLKIQSGYQ